MFTIVFTLCRNEHVPFFWCTTYTLRHSIQWIPTVRTYTLPCIWIYPWRRRVSAHFIISARWKSATTLLNKILYGMVCARTPILNLAFHCRNRKRLEKNQSATSPPSKTTTKTRNAIEFFWWKLPVPCLPRNCP